MVNGSEHPNQTEPTGQLLNDRHEAKRCHGGGICLMSTFLFFYSEWPNKAFSEFNSCNLRLLVPLEAKNESPECLFGLRKQRPWFFWWTSPLWTFWHSGSWFTSIVLATSCFLECNGTPRFQPCEDELEEIGPILLQTRKSWAYVLESMLWELIIQSHVWESVKSLWQVRVCLFHLCT